MIHLTHTYMSNILSATWKTIGILRPGVEKKENSHVRLRLWLRKQFETITVMKEVNNLRI